MRPRKSVQGLEVEIPVASNSTTAVPSTRQRVRPRARLSPSVNPRGMSPAPGSPRRDAWTNGRKEHSTGMNQNVLVVDPYRVLGVPRDASLDLLSRAYRKRSLLDHPNRRRSDHPSADVSVLEWRFAILAASYETLSNPIHRRRYDAIRHDDNNVPSSKPCLCPPPHPDTHDLALEQGTESTGDEEDVEQSPLGGSIAPPRPCCGPHCRRRGSSTGSPTTTIRSHPPRRRPRREESFYTCGATSIPGSPTTSLRWADSTRDSLCFTSNSTFASTTHTAKPSLPLRASQLFFHHNKDEDMDDLDEDESLLSLHSLQPFWSADEEDCHYTMEETSFLFGGPLSDLYRARHHQAFTNPYLVFFSVFGSNIFMSLSEHDAELLDEEQALPMGPMERVRRKLAAKQQHTKKTGSSPTPTGSDTSSTHSSSRDSHDIDDDTNSPKHNGNNPVEPVNVKACTGPRACSPMVVEANHEDGENGERRKVPYKPPPTPLVPKSVLFPKPPIAGWKGSTVLEGDTLICKTVRRLPCGSTMTKTETTRMDPQTGQRCTTVEVTKEEPPESCSTARTSCTSPRISLPLHGHHSQQAPGQPCRSASEEERVSNLSPTSAYARACCPKVLWTCCAGSPVAAVDEERESFFHMSSPKSRKSQQMQSHLQVLLKKKHQRFRLPKSASNHADDTEGGSSCHWLKHFFCHQDSTSDL